MISFSAVVSVTTASVIESGSILGRDLALMTWEGNRYECGTQKQADGIPFRSGGNDDLIMHSQALDDGCE